MNPTKGKGERYIYCPHDGGACLDIVVKYGWSAFNCERCPIYMQSESYGKMDSPVKPGNDAVDDIDFVGARRTVPVDEHVRPAVIATEGKEGEEMAEKEFTKCLVEGCEKEGNHRGMCSAHIQKWRKGTLRGVDPLPTTYGKGTKKDRIKLLKESGERLAKSSKLKAQGSKEGKSQKSEVGSRRSEVSSQKVEVIPAVTEEVTTDMVFSLSSNVEDIEKQNRADVKVFARAFMAGLKGELIAAMTEQMASTDKA